MTERIDFVNILRRVLRQWLFIVTIGIMTALVVGIVTSRMYRPQYETKALIAVYGKDAYSNTVTDAQETADLFKEVITSNLLQKRVAEVLELNSLPGTFSCYNIPSTNMITIKVMASTPENAMLVINGFLDHYDEVTAQLLDDMVLQILEEPKVPMQPVEGYNEKKVLVSTFLGSMAVVAGFLCLYFYFRDDIKNEQQVEKKLDTKLFATIYHENTKKGILPLRKNRKKKGLLVTNPVTSFSYIETFQKLCVRVEYKLKQRDGKTIVLTSVHENEGKSTVAANLALSLAKNGKSVLLVDLDLRKPAQYKLFEIPYEKEQAQVGDVLAGQARLDEAVRKLNVPELQILAGNRSYHNSTKMLIKESAIRMFEQIKINVDYVIFDTPPLSQVADAEEVMQYADAGLLIVRQNVSKTKDINDAIDVFKSAGCKLLGCVYNDVETGVFGNAVFQKESYNYRYGYGYGKRYSKEKAE